MPSTRRAFLAAALAAAAGCTGEPGDRRTPRGTTTGSRETPTEARDGGSDTTPSGGAETPDSAAFTRWTYEAPHGTVGPLTLAPGADGPAVYVGTGASDGSSASGVLAAVSLRDGREQWRLDLPNPPRTAPTYGGDDGPPRLYFETGRESLHGDGARLHAVDPERGEQAWTVTPDEQRFVYPLATSDSAVFVGRRDDLLQERGEFVYALEAADGAERWRVESGDAADDGHAVRRDTFVYTSHRGVRALPSAARSTAADRSACSSARTGPYRDSGWSTARSSGAGSSTSTSRRSPGRVRR